MLAAVERWSPIFFFPKVRILTLSLAQDYAVFCLRSAIQSNGKLAFLFESKFPLSQQTDPICPQPQSCQSKHKQWKHMAGPGRTGSHFIGSLNLDWTQCNIKLHPEFSTTLLPSCVLWLTEYWMISPDNYEEVAVHMWLIPLPPIWKN